nr:hypothetical protein [Achromobacter ruhlandii]
MSFIRQENWHIRRKTALSDAGLVFSMAALSLGLKRVSYHRITAWIGAAGQPSGASLALPHCLN